MTAPRPGHRERKKQATREALRSAALRLALDRGPENVRVDDIAAAAGVSPRTYNNYFSSREQAIVAAVTADRESRIAAAVRASPTEVELSDSVIEAVVDQYIDPGDHTAEVLAMIQASPNLRSRYVETAATIQEPLAEAMMDRDGIDHRTARVLAASVGAAMKIALHDWLRSPTGGESTTSLVVATGPLPDLIRSALNPLIPALEAAAADHRRRLSGKPPRG